MKSFQLLRRFIFIALAMVSINACHYFREGVAKTYYNRAVEKQKKGDSVGAIADYTKALESNPELVQAYVSRGILKHRAGDFKGAIADFNQAIAKNSFLLNAYLSRGDSEAKFKDYNAAIADYSHVISVNPRSAYAYDARGLIRLYGKEDVDGALSDFNKVIEISPSWSPGYLGRAWGKEKKGDWQGASSDVERALQLDPKSHNAHSTRVRIKRKMGDLKGALSDINSAIAADPNVSAYYRERFVINMLLQNWEEAVTDGTRYGQLTKDNRDYVNLLLWMTRIHLGKMDEANQHLTDYLKSVPAEHANEWSTSIAKFLLGKMTEEELFKASNSGEKRTYKGRLCEGWYYAGVKQLAAGDEGAATEHFHKCRETKAASYLEYDLATLELKILSTHLE